MHGTALIIGAGPAGLTAAIELQKSGFEDVMVVETDFQVGGIAKTVSFGGNRIDIGGHRFFSKSDWAMNWWLDMMPLQGAPSKDDIALGRAVPCSDLPNAPDPEQKDEVMLIRSRISRIFYRRKYFDYPISPSPKTFFNLGPMRTLKIFSSYVKASAFPIKQEENLEQFFTNRFGRELYLTFFKDYTEKVWGLPCDKIDASWGAQRVKGLSIKKLITHALSKSFKNGSAARKTMETSLIESFYYPKLGPGQLWETAANRFERNGGRILKKHEVVAINVSEGEISSLSIKNLENGDLFNVSPSVIFSSMPIANFVTRISSGVPDDVWDAASNLPYRDFITVGVLSSRMKMKNNTKIKTVNGIVPDNWIYIQEPDVKVGRLQIFNNWSPYMVADTDTVWVGMEYFCQEEDSFWNMDDASLQDFGVSELSRLGFIDKADVLDASVLRVKKAYPAYFGSYKKFKCVKQYLDSLKNLYPIGRNGLHRYNNMDHSMLTAKKAVDCALHGGGGYKEAIWRINSEEDYHESK